MRLPHFILCRGIGSPGSKTAGKRSEGVALLSAHSMEAWLSEGPGLSALVASPGL